MQCVLALDQGTTSSRAIVFDRQGHLLGMAQREFAQHFPQSGWVEHDPLEIWQSQLQVAREVLDRAGVSAHDVNAIGITNQRETTVLWDRKTGQPVHRAIVWQDRRTAGICDALRASGDDVWIARHTGLIVDAYFSATKLQWMLDHVPGARERAERGELAFGTVDSWLLWRLTGGVHATDATNASRTLLYDIHRQRWDEELLRLLRIPVSVLPKVCDNAHLFGTTKADLFGMPIPVTGMAGDQQAATVGQACLDPGMIKSTYGTGCFALVNTGQTAVASANRLLTTIAYRLDGRATYALEGSIFVAGAAVQWLRDGLRLIPDAGMSEFIARDVPDTGGVYVVPAFTGLGAPWWDPHARGAILGLTRDTSAAHVVRATLEAVGYQTRDLLGAMAGDMGRPPATLRVDGGMVRNDWLCQFLADILDVTVERPAVTETTALGAAFLAGLQAGVFGTIDVIRRQWESERRFEPEMAAAERTRLHQGWLRAVGRVRTS
jgi:glycerol kinase